MTEEMTKGMRKGMTEEMTGMTKENEEDRELQETLETIGNKIGNKIENKIENKKAITQDNLETAKKTEIAEITELLKTRLVKNKKLIFNCVAILFVVLIIFGISKLVGNAFSKDDGASALVTETKEDRGDVDTIGSLEITVDDPIEDSYKLSTLVRTETETGQLVNSKVVTIIYEAIKVRVFNPGTENVVFSSIKLVDDLGNEYKPDSNPPDVTLQDFGRDTIVSPSTMREGYLFFLLIDDDADSFVLTFELESGEKKVFEFDRGLW